MSLAVFKVENNDFAYESGRLVRLTGVDALTQIIKNRLSIWLGEWFLAESFGIDYIGLFNQRDFLEKRFRLIASNAILADSRVEKIIKLDVSFDNSTREITADFVAETSEGLLKASYTLGGEL
jgi:hypothetical protein